MVTTLPTGDRGLADALTLAYLNQLNTQRGKREHRALTTAEWARKEANRLLRDWMIRDALAAGEPPTVVAERAGLSVGRVHQIRRGQ